MADGNAVPIRRLTLYKHGVGFVERQGTLTGDAVHLIFRADDVNDALKSLLVVDRHGKGVHGIDYETPRDEGEKLAASAIRLSADHSLLDLLRALRGWSVRLVHGDGSTSEEMVGRLLGIDVNGPAPAPTLVSLVDDATGAVTSVPLAGLRRVTPLDERVRGDLRFFLDTSRSEEAHRTVTVRLEPGEHDLAISYLVPSPTWRVSYRLVAEAGVEAGGALLLQGWGLFDNRLEEDLDGVAVTLVAGQPISFVYDLATSRIPHRPTVEDEARVAPGPIEYKASLAESAMARAPRQLRAHDMAPMALRADPFMAAAAPALDEVARQEALAEGGTLGELFEYRVTAPVTVGRGESALVPIMNTRLPYRRELLYSERKLPRHPVAALRFTNATGLVLERGPVTVLEDGAYRGEAMVPFTAEGAEVYVPFAVELGISVTSTIEHTQETAAIRIDGALLHTQHATTRHTVYRLENTLSSAPVVTVEHPLWTGAHLISAPEPDARLADAYRWTATCPPRGVTTLMVAERRDAWSTTQLLDLSYARLEEFFAHRWLSRAVLEELKGVLDNVAAIARNRETVGTLHRERDALYAREEQLRQNIAALGTAGEEGTLRRQVVGRLAASEERLAEIEEQLRQLEDDIWQRQAVIDAEVAALQVEPRADA